MQGSEPAQHSRIGGNTSEFITGLRDRVMKSSAIQTTVARTVPMMFAAMLFISPALAQSGAETGGTLCSDPGYNFFVALVYVICGLSILAIVAAIFSGGAMKALGFVSNSVSRAGNKALVGGMASFGLIALTLGIAAVGFGTIPVDIPGECVTFF